MTSKGTHKKHGDLVKPKDGKFGRSEVAFYGTTCDEVASLVQTMRGYFPTADLAFVDADHHAKENEFFGTHWQDKIDAVQLTTRVERNDFQQRIQLNQADAILVNGNHFQAKNQIVICNSDKEASLRKRKDELTNVVAVFVKHSADEIPVYIQEVVPNFHQVKIVSLDQEEEIQRFFSEQFLTPPSLKALIMAGGRSIRMGRDKTRLDYHGEEQFMYLKKMLDEMKIPVFISCRPEQQDFFQEHGCQVITDRIMDMGPSGGIISAFMSHPDDAFLVLACDVPLLDQQVLNELIESRTPSAIATSFKSPYDKFPEPLIAIWEPKAYPMLLQFMALGHSCPRKVLINGGAKVIESSQPEKLVNVNTMDDLQEVLEKIQS